MAPPSTRKFCPSMAMELPTRKPHIVFLLADDFAYEMWPRRNNNSSAARALLPNIARHFVSDGLQLERHYSYKLCAPARASLLSGRWPHRAYELEGGMRACKGLSPGVTTLAEKLRDGAGYDCHFVGKWHLGYATPEYCPWRRGFRSSEGYFGSGIDKFTR